MTCEFTKGDVGPMRARIFEIIEKSKDGDQISAYYDFFMLFIIIASLVPLAFKEETTAFIVIDKICVCIFVVDYILRWMTADYKFESSSVLSFVRYPFSFMAIIDLLSILPSLSIISRSFKMLRLLRMFRAMRVFRIFKAMRYSKNVYIILEVLKKTKRSLIAVCILAGGYILIAALVIFNVEPDTFDNFFEAVYWATVSLTTVGYGDIYPTSSIGRIFTMLSSFFGIAIVALPAGIITAGYMKELEDDNNDLE